MTDRFHSYFWPTVVICLLLTSIGMMTAVLFAARSDGGAQVVDDYYSKAVAWDSLAALNASSEARQWQVAYRNLTTDSASVDISDSTGAPVTGLTGTVLVRRPQHADALFDNPIVPGSRPGAYSFGMSGSGAGIWIFEMRLDTSEGAHRHVTRTWLER